MKIVRRILYSLLALFALLWFPPGSSAQGSGSKPCGCTQQDKLDLESRIKQTEAAMRELDRMIKGWEQKDKGSMTLEEGGNQNEMSGEEFRENILMRELGFAMFPAYMKGARVFGARTDPACDVIVPPQATQCLRGALGDHEAVHGRACKANKGLNPFVDWRNGQRIVDYLKEEREGYQKEHDRLSKEQETQTKQCTPTQLDPSAKQLLQQTLAQQDRLNQANTRLQSYATSLK